jgi:tetratricopeptide (TPR) repeat protein
LKIVLSLILALSLAAETSETHIKAAVTAFRNGQAARSQEGPQAEKSFLRAIDIEPTYAEAYHALADLYLDTGRTVEAGAILTRYLQIDPRSLADRLRLAKLLLDQRQSVRAAAQFVLALKIAPQSADALYGFAIAADRNSWSDRALAAARRGVKEFPGDARFSELVIRIQNHVSSAGDSPD